MSRRKKKRASQKPGENGVAIYHDMRVEENFERCAQRLVEMVASAARTHPRKERYLYLDVQGHRNDVGGWDRDAYEIMGNFLLTYLMPYLTKAFTPLGACRNPRRQRDDIPGLVQIADPDELPDQLLDLAKRVRGEKQDSRRSRPSLAAIADYLGVDEVACIVCWSTPVHRAHAVPDSLGGSNDVRNFAPLCELHHRQAPDVIDAESFWRWIDYARAKGERERVARMREMAPALIPDPGPRTDAPAGTFFGQVKGELIELYGWVEGDFEGLAWSRVLDDFYVVLEQATGKHFGVDRKVSTYAWAYNVAKKRVELRGLAGRASSTPDALTTP
ncbi:HNH endonuclease [Micromonospora sp. NPDC005205]|uniref:HNH endonuclease signature motif containing protein n=1 Tax=Micromonospora sp. NPDC005205 TaxID=3156714 RepID=UPI0033BE3684